ncbi:hypothetical protein K438DRAFT_575568 [Mycena galopus ATCC 62051]|nr:hypothetical protein K438DRAFT_575568 [Mycena galopus ATCC 62051]
MGRHPQLVVLGTPKIRRIPMIRSIVASSIKLVLAPRTTPRNRLPLWMWTMTNTRTCLDFKRTRSPTKMTTRTRTMMQAPPVVGLGVPVLSSSSSNEIKAAEARKAAKIQKADKAARKQELLAAGRDADQDLGPRPDDQFSARTVDSRPATIKKKSLTQRNSKVPQPIKMSDWRGAPPPIAPTTSTSTRHARDIRDASYDHHPNQRARSQSPIRFRGRSPAPPARSPSPAPIHNTNGGVVPRHIELDLHHRARSLSSDRSEFTRGGRPLSPIAGDKRARSPHDEDLRTVQVQQLSTSGRAKAKDFDDVTQEVLTLGIKNYRVLVSAEHGFPDQATELEFLGKSWTTAAEDCNVNMDVTAPLSKMITGRASHLRGELKTKSKPCVEVMYGFKSGHNKKTIGSNRQLAEDLKANLTFTFKDIESRKGIYRHPILQKIVNDMWFANKRDEGPKYPEYFNPFPKPGLALVLTAIENSIDEWATGIRTDVPFTANDYRSVYEDHLEALNRFETETQPHKILDNILVRLHNIGRFHSGSQPLIVATTSSLSQADIKAAIREYEDDEETETDGEEGD